MLRQLNPARLERTLISPLNPWLSWLKPAAEYVRAHRQPVSADNPLWQLQEQWSGWMEQGLNHYRDLRDAATEHCFKAVYESPWLASVVGVQPARETRAARCDSWDKQERLQLKRQVLDPAYESGTLADGFVRLLIYVAIGRGIIDERPFNAIRRIMRDIRHEYPMTLMQLKDIARKQVFLVRLDEARALAGLPAAAARTPAPSGLATGARTAGAQRRHHPGTTTTAGPSGPHAATGRPRPGAGHPAARRAPVATAVAAPAPTAKASAPAKKAAAPRKAAVKAPAKTPAKIDTAAKPAPAAKPAVSKAAPSKPAATKTAKAPAAKTPATRKPAAGNGASKPKTPGN